MTLDDLQRELDLRDKGVLMRGSHREGAGEFCALEFARAVKGLPWGDTPDAFPDLRPLNDARWSSDQARTEALLPVLLALWDWHAWDSARRVRWARRVAILTVQRIVSELPTLPDDIRDRCRRAATMKEARIAAADADANADAYAATNAAAYAADAYAATNAGVYAAYAAAYAANAGAYADAYAATNAGVYAAYAAAYAAYAAAAAADHVLRLACEIWIEAAV